MSRNIGGDSFDPNYRYRRPILTIKQEPRSTRLTNIVEVARSLNRESSYISKYLGKKLGIRAMWDAKTKTTILAGIHTVRDLETKLEEFIEEWVLCDTCKLPETSLILDEGNLCMDCKVCGKIRRCT